MYSSMSFDMHIISAIKIKNNSVIQGDFPVSFQGTLFSLTSNHGTHLVSAVESLLYVICISVPPSTHISGTSCSRWESTRAPKLDDVQKVRGFGALSPKWDVFTKLLPPQGSGVCAEEETERL